MASPDYGRRHPSCVPVGNSIFQQGSGDHNPMYGSAQQYCHQESYDEFMISSSGGPRPLNWGVGTPAVSSRHTASRSPEVTAQYAINLSAVELARYSQNSNGLDYVTQRERDSYAAAYPAAEGAGLLQSKLRTSAEAAAPRYSAAVMGPEIAGYKSVLTKNPVSPSGYSLAAPPPQTASYAAGAGSIGTQGNHHPSRSTATPTAAMPAAQSHSPSARSAAAAAAALAALNGSRVRSAQKPDNSLEADTSSTENCSYNCSSTTNGAYINAVNIFDTCVGGGAYGCSQPPTPTDNGRPAALNWKLPAQPNCTPNPGISHAAANHAPIAGRRAAPAATNTVSARHTTADTSSSYVPSSSPAGQRPPSQQRTEGLSKLKQLASARLVNRITTPPTEDLVASATGAAVRRTSRRASSAVSSEDVSSQISNVQSIWPEQCQQQQHQQVARVATSYQPSRCIDQSPQGTTHSSSQQQVASSSRRVSLAQKQHLQSLHPAQDTVVRQNANVHSHCQLNQQGHPVEAGRMSGSQPAADKACQQCPSCGRRFVESAYQKHVKICDKVFGQKRKAFNMQQQRLQDTDAAKYSTKAATGRPEGGTSKGAGGIRGQQNQQQGLPGKAVTSKQLDSRPAVSAAAGKKSKWQQQSEQLRAAMRAAHAGSGNTSNCMAGSGRGALSTASNEADDRIPCPHCGRKFAELVAERHIPKCADIMAKPKELKAGGGKAAYMRNNSRQGR